MMDNLKKIRAFVKKEITSTLAYKYSFLSTIAFSIISLLFYFMMAGIFKAVIVPSMIPYGGNYLAFLISGAILWQMVTFGLYAISSKLTYEMISGTFESVYLTRANILLLIVGVSLFSLGTNLIMSIVTLVLASSLFSIPMHLEMIPNVLLIMFLTYLSMLGLGIIIAGVTIVTKSVGQVVAIFTLAMSFLCGILIPTELLPSWAKTLSSFIPLTYALDALRKTLLEGAPLALIMPALFTLILMSAMLIPLGYYVFFYCLRTAKKQGSISQF